MRKSEEIHLSVAEVDDLEEVQNEPISIKDVFFSIFTHPAQIFLRWNWKVALIGSLVRGTIYLVTYKATNSWVVTIAAVLVELGFRFLTSGFFGALTQSFRRAEPAWLASLLVTIMFPFISHVVEYFTHFAQEKWFSDMIPAAGNEVARLQSFAISVLFSILSALFNMYMMRHGVLLVGAGEETKKFTDDLKSIPMLLVHFTIYLPNQIMLAIFDGKILWALSLFISFGLAVGTILGVCRGKWTWAERSALGAWALLLFAVICAGIYYLVLHLSKPRIKE